MATYILILFLYVGPWGDTDSVTVASIPGFTTQQECEAAGQATGKLVAGTKKEREFVCVKQTKDTSK